MEFRSESSGVDVERVARAHQRELWRYLRVLGAAASDADDLVQETFVVVLQRDFRVIDARATRVFLRRTARQLFLARFRRRRSERQTLARWCDEVDREWDRERDADGWLEALQACRDGLGARPRRAIDLHYREHRRLDAIAAELGMTLGSVKVLLHRARRSLRDCIERRLGWS